MSRAEEQIPHTRDLRNVGVVVNEVARLHGGGREAPLLSLSTDSERDPVRSQRLVAPLQHLHVQHTAHITSRVIGLPVDLGAMQRTLSPG